MPLYRITPSGHAQAVLAPMRLLHACLWQACAKPSYQRLFGLQDHISLEIAAKPDHLQLQAWTPTRTLGQTLSEQLRSHFPGATVERIEPAAPAPPSHASTGLVLSRDRDCALRVPKESEPDPLAGVLAGMAYLHADEIALLQVLVRPLLLPRADTLVFEAIIRLFAGSQVPEKARLRLRRIVAAFGPYGAQNTLKPTDVRLNSAGAATNLWARRWPAVSLHAFALTLEELTALYHLPSSTGVHLPSLYTAGALRLPMSTKSPAQGVRLGLAMSGTGEREVRLALPDLRRHLALFGASGTGKSTLLLNLGSDLMAEGSGLSVLDPHGTLVAALLSRVPPHRARDVVVVRFADVEHPVGLNFLTARPGYEFLVVDELAEICQRIYGNSYWGPVLDMVLRQAAYATLEAGGTLVEMARVLQDDRYRQAILPQVSNLETRAFLHKLSGLRAGAREHEVASTYHRLQRFLGTPFIRNIVGQARSTIDVRQVMDERRILLVDLAGIGVTNAQFLGSLMTLLFRQAALAREALPEADRVPHFLFMDECSWFISQSVGEMADQMRKFGLGMTLAAQRVSQLKPQDTRDAVFTSVGNVICFQTGDVDDARYLAQHLNTPGLTGEEIRSLGRYEAYLQVVTQGAKCPAFWARTPPPPPILRSSEQVTALLRSSREKCTRMRADVEAEITSRFRSETHDEPEKRHR